MKKEYVEMFAHINTRIGTVKSAEGDNIKYPKVKRAYQVEDTTGAL